MAIARVGAWTSAQFNNNTGGSLAGRTSTAGNHVEISSSNSNPATYTIAHSQAGTVLQSRAAEANGGDSIKGNYIENIAGGASHTISITTPAGSFSTLHAAETSGLATSGSFDTSAVGTGSGGSIVSGTTGTTALADELLVGYGTASTGGNGAWTAGASFTMEGNIGNGGSGGTGYLEDRIVAATGTYNAPVGNPTAFSNWIAAIVTFKAAGGGGGPAFVAQRPLIATQAVRRASTI